MLTNAAIAADPYVDAAYDWSGLYAGIKGGLAKSDFEGIYDSGGNPGPVDLDVLDGSYPTIGGRIGYNHQFDSFVVGLEADGAFGVDKDEFEISIFGGGAPFTHLSTELNFLGSVRARAGMAFDRLLLIGSAGYGYADFTFKGRQDGGIDAPPTSLSETDWGPVVGLGAEYAFSENVVMNVQYSHYFVKTSTDLDAASFIDADPGDVLELDGIGQIELGLTWKF